MAKFYVKLLLVGIFFVDQHLACEETMGQELQRMYLSYGRIITITKNSTIICANISSLNQIEYTLQERQYDQFLKITRSTIPTIPSLGFSKFSSIVKLFLSGISIEKIQPGAFTGLTTLKELYLNDNALTEVSNGVYNSLHQLEVLSLDNNKIEKIEDYALVGATSLVFFSLKNNNISRVNDHVFDFLKNLRILDLARNPLSSFSSNGLPNLDFLNLTETSLSELSGDWSHLTIRRLDLTANQFKHVDFVKFPKTLTMELSKNQIVSLQNCNFVKSQIVNLDYNQIQAINGTFTGLVKLNLSHNHLRNLTTFGFDKTIETLDLSFNNISTIDGGLFRGLDTLKQLYLQGNDITRIDNVWFRDLTALQLLNLSDNRIDEFRFGVFDTLTKLEVLDVSNNKLKDLHQYTLNSLSNLRDLHFDNNEISSLNEIDLRKHLPRLRTVSLDKNPWVCQDLVKIENILKSVSITVMNGANFDVENFHGIECHNVKDESKDLQNSKMGKFFNEDFENSRFFQFLNTYELSVERREILDEKLTAVQEKPEDYESKIFACGVVVQVVVLVLLLLVVFLIFKSLKNVNVQKKRPAFSDLEMF